MAAIKVRKLFFFHRLDIIELTTHNCFSSGHTGYDVRLRAILLTIYQRLYIPDGRAVRADLLLEPRPRLPTRPLSKFTVNGAPVSAPASTPKPTQQKKKPPPCMRFLPSPFLSKHSKA